MENLKNVAPIEDFNWDAYENGETVTNVSHDELEKAYDGTLNKVNDREVVDGTVIAMNKREVVVNIGYKSDGIIPLMIRLIGRPVTLTAVKMFTATGGEEEPIISAPVAKMQ